MSVKFSPCLIYVCSKEKIVGEFVYLYFKFVCFSVPFSISESTAADCSNLNTTEECCNVDDTTIDHNCTFVLCEGAESKCQYL